MKNILRITFAIFLAAVLSISFLACGKTDTPGKVDEETKMNENETQKPEEQLKVSLDTLTLDDSRYSIGEFKKNVYEYTVGLPDGRPAVPRVQATAAEGVEIKISQAAIPDGATSGKATVVATDAEGNKATYTVEFVRDIVNGFVLQYDDRYVFNPGYHNDTGDKYVFESSDPDIISIDENGVMTAKKVADKEVTLIAKQGTVEKATFIVDRVEKAHINLFFITGQSNGQGCYDSSNYGKDIDHLIAFEDQIKLVEKIGGEGRVYSYDVYPRSQNTEVAKRKGAMYDMELYAKQGHQASLGKAFYDLSGEKVVFLQSAYSGAPIESWLDPARHKEESGTYGGNYFYTDTLRAYKTLMKKLEENYEVVCTANFWCQGETAMTSVYNKKKGDYIFSSDPAFDANQRITDETYYKYFMMIHEDMKADFGLDYSGIMFVKTKGWTNQTTRIVPIISAQFALCNNNDEIFVATRKFIEIARGYNSSDKTSEGYGFMGTDNNHYNQIGYNYHGNEAGVNAFNTIFGVATTETVGIEVIAQDGVTRMTNGQNVPLTKNSSVRLGALSLPHHVNEKITWVSDNEAVATVNEFGVVTGVASGSASITVSDESGNTVKLSITVK